MNIYHSLQNPLTDEVMRTILENYSKKSSMYSVITRTDVSNKIKGKYNIQDRDNLYTYIFQEWKKSILYLLKKDNIKEKYKAEAVLLADYLKTVNPKTYQEVREIMDYEEIKSELLKKAMSDFAWSKIGEYSGWEHIHSNYIYCGVAPVERIEHRLYLNCDSTVTHKIALRFMQKCIENRIPYYFKFDDFGARNDTFVIYCDTKHLDKYITILREIKKEEKLTSTVHEPPILTSKIDNWIGYGSQPKDDDTSFNGVRAVHLEKCIKEESSKWMARNLNTAFKLNGVSTAYKEYLLNGIIKTIIDHAQRYTGEGENYKKHVGYELKDVLTKNFELTIRREVLKHAEEIIAYFTDKKSNINIELPFMAGKVRLNSSLMEDIRRKQVQFMTKNSTRFRTDVKNRVINTANIYGIDRDNYAVDTHIMEKLGKQTKKPVSKIEIETPVSKKEQYKVQPQEKQGYIYQAMTEEEIKASRKKLGF